MRRHFEDVHQPGEYPCKVCGKVFSSYNKVTSHYSRVCRKNLSRSGPWQHPCDRCGIVLKSEYYLIHREKCQKLTSTFKGVESLRKTQSAVEEDEDEPVAYEESPIVKKSIVTNFSNISQKNVLNRFMIKFIRQELKLLSKVTLKKQQRSN